MSGLLYPKPSENKKKKLYNGYKDKPNRKCYYSDEYGAERHEVFGGPNRQTSIQMGFQVDLSPENHYKFHNPETPEDFARILYWKQYYQKEYEQKLIKNGIAPEQARQAWIWLIGKNYLEELPEDKPCCTQTSPAG